MNRPDVPAIVAAQRAYFLSGKTRPVEARAQALTRLRAALVRHEADMIAAAKEDMGRADVETYFMEIAMNLEELDYASKHLAQWTRTETVKTPTLFFMAETVVRTNRTPNGEKPCTTTCPSTATGCRAGRRRSKISTMFGCCSCTAIFASSTNIFTKSSSAARFGRMRLIATGRSKPSTPREAARKTSAIPPIPTRSRRT